MASFKKLNDIQRTIHNEVAGGWTQNVLTDNTPINGTITAALADGWDKKTVAWVVTQTILGTLD